MNRRTFIKSFAIVGSSIPIATSLANVKGVDKVIETFQLSDIEPIARANLAYTKEENSGTINYDFNTDNIVSGTFDFEPNEMNFKNGKNIYCLCKDFDSFQDLFFNIKNKMQENRFIYDLDKNIVWLDIPEKVMGIKIHSNIIGDYNYWLNPENNEIMRQLYLKDVEILTPAKIFRVIGD